MLISKLWARYFLKEFFKVFVLFTACFYALYILIDYSSHTGSYHAHHVRFGWWELAVYYLCEWLNRVEVLIPFAILIATTRTLCQLNVHRELIALMAAGLPLKTLLKPFVWVGFIFALLLMLNTEILLPYAKTKLKWFEDTKRAEKNKHNDLLAVQTMALEDRSTLLFQKYDSALDQFLDVYWVKSMDEVIHMKTLNLNHDVPIGSYVDHLLRDHQGNLSPVQAFEREEFPDIRYSEKSFLESITTPDQQSLSDLWWQLPSTDRDLTEKESAVLTSFYHKLALPWLCLLAVIGPAPFCLHYTRHLRQFLIYAAGIFGLISAYLLLNSASVLGSRQVLDPLWAIGTPFCLLSLGFSLNYWKKV